MVAWCELRERIDAFPEWLLVREGGRSFPLLSTEIELTVDDGKTLFGFADDGGFHQWRLKDFQPHESGIGVEVAGAFGRGRETLRLVPRVPAVELARTVELARLEHANEIARHLKTTFPGARLERVALNTDGGRLAQITFALDGKHFAAMADVTRSLNAELMATHAMLWYERLGSRRKKPVFDIFIVAEKRSSHDLQKLHALLSERWKAIITVLEISRKTDPPTLVKLPKRNVRDLWRERAKKIVLPADPRPSSTATAIIGRMPDSIDVLYSRQGETLRFNGLPFARVRTVMGKERAWFGVGRERAVLTAENVGGLDTLIAELGGHRVADASNRRHELYRTASEAWLESILRRNIRLLDANLILSPIYNQFRSLNDRVDLLALRRDGRLVVIELKTQHDISGVFQAADYWRKIELQRRRGVLAAADLFGGLEIADRPALVYIAAPALSFHRDFEYFARAISPHIELWRFELHEKWRAGIKVLNRRCYAGHEEGLTNR